MTFNHDIAPSTIKEAIKKLETISSATDGYVKLSRKDIGSLTEALRDLDKRTSGIEKLPDGRTKLGHFTGGRPEFVVEEHNAARDSFGKKDYRKALRHSVNAINAYEQSKIIEGCMATGRLTSQAVGKLYYLAASCAQRLHNKQLAYRYAKRSTEAESNARNMALLSTTLANLGAIDEAIKHIQKALRQDPLNRKYQKLKRTYARISETSVG